MFQHRRQVDLWGCLASPHGLLFRLQTSELITFVAVIKRHDQKQRMEEIYRSVVGSHTGEEGMTAGSPDSS